MPLSFGRLQDVARASYLQIARQENAEHGGLLLRQRAQELLLATLDSEYAQRREQWSAWLKAAIPAALTQSHDELAAVGVTAGAVEEAASRAGRRFQAVAREQIAQVEARSPRFRIRKKLHRWRLPGVPRQLARRQFAAPPGTGGARAGDFSSGLTRATSVGWDVVAARKIV